MTRLRFPGYLAAMVLALVVLFALGWLRGVTAFVVLIGLCVLFHETGHFLVARACGMGVPEYSIGFGRSLVSVVTNSTTYHIRAIPVGGYVKIAGFQPGEDEDAPNGFFAKPRWMGALVLVAGSLMNVVLAALLFVLMGLVWGEKVRDTNIIAKVQQSMPAAGAGLLAGDEIVAVDGDRRGTELARVQAGSPAARAGLKPGDRVLYVNDAEPAGSRELERLLEGACREGSRSVRFYVFREEAGHDPLKPLRLKVPEGPVPARDALAWLGMSVKPLQTRDIMDMISGAPGRQITLAIRRDGRERQIAVVPKALLDKVEGKDAKDKLAIQTRPLGRIGIVFKADMRRIGVAESIKNGFAGALGVVVVMARGFWMLATGQIPAEAAGGPVRILREVSQAAQAGPLNVLNTIALISVNLAVLNLLPIPVLDGGHLAILGWESVIRRRISERTRMAVLFAGLVLLVAAMVLITARDVWDWILQKIT